MAEAWCGHKLADGCFFGVRRNLRGAQLESHIDHDPKVSAFPVGRCRTEARACLLRAGQGLAPCVMFDHDRGLS